MDSILKIKKAIPLLLALCIPVCGCETSILLNTERRFFEKKPAIAISKNETKILLSYMRKGEQRAKQKIHSGIISRAEIVVAPYILECRTKGKQVVYFFNSEIRFSSKLFFFSESEKKWLRRLFEKYKVWNNPL